MKKTQRSQKKKKNPKLSILQTLTDKGTINITEKLGMNDIREGLY